MGLSLETWSRAGLVIHIGDDFLSLDLLFVFRLAMIYWYGWHGIHSFG